MKRVLYLVRRGPGRAADETIDLALVSCVFEQPTTMLFLDDGVYQLAGLEARQSSVKALPTYEVQAIHAATHSLAQRGIDAAGIDLPIQLADRENTRHLLATHDVVVSD